MLVCSLPCTTTYTLPPSQAPARALWAPRPSAGPWLCRPAAASRRPLRALAEGGVAEGGAGRVVVRGLPPAIDRRNVSALFSRFGNVTAAQLARGAPPGPPSRTGFVLFSDAEGARRAAEGLHGATVCDASVCSAIEVQPASGATHRLWSRIQAVRRDLQLRERLEGAGAGDLDRIAADAAAEMAAALDEAKAAPVPAPEAAWTDLQDIGSPVEAAHRW